MNLAGDSLRHLGAVVMGTWLLVQGAPVHAAEPGAGPGRDALKRAKVYLAAGDYRRALDACLKNVEESPGAPAYVFVTYVYHAIDGYLDALAKADKWGAVEMLYLNLSGNEASNVVDPPDVLARIAKEIVQNGVRKQADIYAAMAAKLDSEVTNRLWTQQTAWRTMHPENWWEGVPESWGW